jgi:hypothetical protein
LKFLMSTLFLVSTSYANAVVCFPPTGQFYPQSNNVTVDATSKAQFNGVIDQFEAYAKPLATKAGWKDLEVMRRWTDNTINADTYHENGKIVIRAFGGLYRHPKMTNDAFKLVLCHELGHTFGGPPLYTGEDMSVEGQADYYSTDNCALAMGLPWKNPSLALARVLAELNGEPVPALDTPDQTVVQTTYEGHPHAQCRLDTYHAGAEHADRPLCWYSPKGLNYEMFPNVKNVKKNTSPKAATKKTAP